METTVRRRDNGAAQVKKSLRNISIAIMVFLTADMVLSRVNREEPETIMDKVETLINTVPPNITEMEQALQRNNEAIECIIDSIEKGEVQTKY